MSISLAEGNEEERIPWSDAENFHSILFQAFATIISLGSVDSHSSAWMTINCLGYLLASMANRKTSALCGQTPIDCTYHIICNSLWIVVFVML